MAKKVLVILIFAVFAATGAFAQDFQTMPKNTITYDAGPTFVGFTFNSMESAIQEDGITGRGLGLAFQYERQLSEYLSLAGRFAYLAIDVNYTDTSQGINIGLDMNLTSFSLEGHVRFYPSGDAFFLDGMMGYTNFSSDFSGRARVNFFSQPINLNASGNYLKLGAKIGWRINFGRPGGFTFEPAFGYYHGIALGKSVGQQFADELGGDADIKDAFDMIEQFMFVGGPRLSLGFGWRF